MYLYFLILGFYIFQIYSNTTSCEVEQYEQKMTCYGYFNDCYILQGNEEDYYNLKNIDQEIIQKAFTLPFKDLPIQIKIFKSEKQVFIYQKLICSLFLNLKYYITCMSYNSLNYGINGNLQEEIRIETNISSEESCDEFYQLNDGNFMIFCLTQFNLKQYFVSKLGNSSFLLYEYDVSNQIQDKCKKKQYRLLDNNQFLIAFFQCSKWKIFEFTKQEKRIIMEPGMKEYGHLLKQFSKIDDVQFCQSKLVGIYLIEGYHYLQFYWQQNYQEVFPTLFITKNKIQKLVLFQFCSKLFLITHLKEINMYQYDYKNHEIILEEIYSFDQIQLFSDFLFLQNQNELTIILDQHLKQKYQILNSSLHFFEQDNLFYQIDKTQNTLQFYIYYPFSGYIEPKQQFLYMIARFSGFAKKQLLMCLKIEYENLKQEHEFQGLIFKNCENNQSTLLSFLSFQSFLQNEFILSQLVNVSIWNEVQLEILCYSQLKKYSFNKKIQLKSLRSENLVFQDENSINFLNCSTNKIQLIINTQKNEVFEYLGNYYIINKQKKSLKMIKFSQGLFNEIQEYSNIEIIRVEQIQKQLAFYIKNQQFPLLVYSNQFQQVKEDQLEENLYQPEQILYYSQLGAYKFIQYPNIFALELDGVVKSYKFSGIQIIQIRFWIMNHFEILGVQIETNSLILYHIDFFELNQVFNYTLKEYYFLNPLTYIFDLNHLAIQIEQNQPVIIALFSFKNKVIKLNDIIFIDDNYFEFYDLRLFYLKNKQLIQHYLNEISVNIETNMNIQQPFFSDYLLKLRPNYQYENNANINLLIQNECHRLYPNNDIVSYRQKIKQNLLINISKLFSGPIQNLQIKNNSKIQLTRPFQSIQEIKSCQKELNFCVKQAEFLISRQDKVFFSVIIQEEKILVAFQQNNLYQVLWAKENYFFLFCSLQEKIEIRLLQCFKKENENCKEVQQQIINFKSDLKTFEDILKTQNLVRLKNQKQQIYLLIQDQNFSVFNLPNMNEDIQYIEQSLDYFASVSWQDYQSKSKVELNIYQININGCTEIFSQLITKEIQMLLPFFFQQNGSFRNIQLVSCVLNGNVTIIALLLINNQGGSFIINISIDIKQGSIINQQLTKQIRNPPQSFQFSIDYVDQNQLIFGQRYQNKTYFYDLQEERTFYDYIYRLDSQIQIISCNTTHFIFINQSMAYLGRIKYEINLVNISDFSFNFILYAYNEVSDAQILVQITLEDTFMNSNKNIIIIEIIDLILILLFLGHKRQMKVKRKMQKNQILK